MSYTYALLEISRAAYDEIKAKLEAAEYQDQFHQQDDGRVALDMHGIALVPGSDGPEARPMTAEYNTQAVVTARDGTKRVIAICANDTPQEIGERIIDAIDAGQGSGRCYQQATDMDLRR